MMFAACVSTGVAVHWATGLTGPSNCSNRPVGGGGGGGVGVGAITVLAAGAQPVTKMARVITPARNTRRLVIDVMRTVSRCCYAHLGRQRSPKGGRRHDIRGMRPAHPEAAGGRAGHPHGRGE